MKKIFLLIISSVSFVFGSSELLKDTEDIVEIHESHQPLEQAQD